MAQANLDVSQVMEALRRVQEPELHKDIVTLNMVKDVAVKGSTVSLTFVLTTPACPLKTEIENSIRQELLKLEGVEDVKIRIESSVPKSRDLQGRVGIPGVKNIIAVASGKGGVGKTTVAVNVSVALQRMGAAVALMDADVYGPNVPRMMGVHDTPRAVGDRILPLEGFGIRVMSMGFLNPGDRPLIWRGPMLHSVIQQFLRNVDWGELDYLILDLPPGTGDVQLSLTQTVPLSGGVIVTTPSDVALEDARKAIEMFRQVKVEILGIVENMSYFVCPHCSERVDIFSHGGGKKTSEDFGVPFLGEVPLDPEVRAGGDFGAPVAARGPESAQARAFYDIAKQVAARVSVANLTAPPAELITIRP
ncbi:MAG: Mrp/NBP35 family ATP-binding protein [Acidobacteria bacterium]|nr:Mrp/NBP35 family ATP-binding protein [Acidobacteriota bacterium]